MLEKVGGTKLVSSTTIPDATLIKDALCFLAHTNAGGIDTGILSSAYFCSVL